jgi:hypothetical protein
VLRNPAMLDGAPPATWDQALRLARASNLLARLALDLTSIRPLHDWPPYVAPHLVAALRLAEHQQAAIERECRHLQEALAELDIPLVLLKGAAYAMTGRSAARGRLFGDVDLLVPRKSLGAVEAALMMHGWTVGAIDPYDNRYYRTWMHELPPMTHLRRGTVVDVHHHIVPLTSRHVIDTDRLLNDSLEVAGTGLRVLSPADMVIHSAVHLFHEGELKNGLRDLMDLVALLEEFAADDPDFAARVLDRACELGLVWPAALALRFAARLGGASVPAGLLERALRQGGIGRLRCAFFDAIYLRALLPEHELADSPGTGAARGLIYLRAHSLRMPLPLLALHLSRKLALRLVKHSSRSAN